MNRISTLIFSCLLYLSTASAQSPVPFDCIASDGFGYYSSSASASLVGGNLTYSSSRISRITTADGARQTVCSAETIGTSLNGLAFNPHDNYLYAVSRYDEVDYSGKLYRIGENCEKVEIPVTGPIVKFTTNSVVSIDAAGGNISSATFDLDNNYYVSTAFASGGATGFTNKLQKIEIINEEAVVRSTVTLTCPSCTGTSRLRITDMIYDEATDLLLGSNKELDKLYSIDPVDGILTEIGSTGINTSILGIYKNIDGNVRAISAGGNIYSVDTNTGAFTLLSTISALNSSNADGASGCYAPQKISGHLYIDANGLTDGMVNGIGTNMSGTTTLYAHLIKDGLVIKSDVLSADGSYQFLGAADGTYEVRLSSTRGAHGIAPPAAGLPATYQWTGDHTGAFVGSDGSPDGTQSVTITPGLDRTEINFGINAIPVATDLTAPVQINPGGNEQVPVAPLTISDVEDTDLRNITIITIPDPATMGTVYYDGLQLTAGQTITDYDPSLLFVDPVDNEVTVVFTYHTTDAAGAISNTATVTLPFAFSVLPVELIAFTGQSSSTTNTLSWNTAQEHNSNYFSVQRRAINTDFVEIGRVTAAGTSDHELSYRFVDREVLPTAYYRLLSVDLDGSTAISETIRLQTTEKIDIKLYPTIATDLITLQVPQVDNRPQTYQILDMQGQILRTGTLTSTVSTLDIHDLSAGRFYINIFGYSAVPAVTSFIKVQ